MMRLNKWTALLAIGFCEVLGAQPARQVPAQPIRATVVKAERTTLVRGQEVIVQELIMGPEATLLWRKIQQLIAAPDIKDLRALIDIFDLKITEPIDLIDWRKPGGGGRDDITSSNRLITKGRYGIVDQTKTFNQRILYFDLEFNINNFCLTKQEIQRQYTTGWEVAAVHSPQFLWDDKTGAEHGFPLTDANGGFSVSASGCVTKYGAKQILKNTNEGTNK